MVVRANDVAGFVVSDPAGRTVHRESFPSAHLPAATLAARMNRHEAKLARAYGSGFRVEAGLFNSSAAFDHFFPPHEVTPLGPHALPDAAHIPVAARLIRLGVAPRVIVWVEADVRVEENAKQLIAEVGRRFAAPERDRILSALRLAEAAHAGQTQLDRPDIPYTNHVVATARLVMSSGGSADAIAAALLHDAVEDSDLDASTIEEACGKRTRTLVAAVTHAPEQSRADYLEHVRGLDGEALLVKGADRVHNLLRSLTRRDDAAVRTYVAETRHTFDALFTRPELRALQPLYSELLEACARV